MTSTESPHAGGCQRPDPGAGQAVPSGWRTLTTHTEIIFGAVRLDPGTYEVRRVSTPDAEPEF